jgi:Mn-containing catalase
VGPRHVFLANAYAGSRIRVRAMKRQRVLKSRGRTDAHTASSYERPAYALSAPPDTLSNLLSPFGLWSALKRAMYHHIKKLMYTVRIGVPDPRFGNMLLEQFGGANGELAAAMQYSIQGLNCDDPERKDLLMDIGTEELSHLEVVGTLARMHLKPLKSDRSAAHADPLIAIAGGGGVGLFNSMGDAWTADYLKITGELDVDLRSNIAAEARAKIVYERLINFTDDQGTIDTLQFLMTREITHMKAFTAALESMGKPAFSIGRIPPTPGLVDQYFNDSTGTGDRGEPDARGPWNEGGEWELITAPAFQEFESPTTGTRQPGSHGSSIEH